MAIATEQLETIYKEITEAFSKTSQISIEPVEGNPPDSYEITYKVKGLQKTDGGDIEEKGNHVITMSIPFGFPHFPPSCKPKSPIFHPDFDPAAICIGDFWEKNRSIVELIKHIRKMISGEIYSPSNAFNEEAVRWYTEKFAKQEQAVSEPFTDPVVPSTELGGSAVDELTSLLDDDIDDTASDDLLGDFNPEDDSPSPALSFVEEPAGRNDDKPEESLDSLFQESDFDFESPTPTEESREDDLFPSDFSGELEKEVVTDEVDIAYLQELAGSKRYFGLDNELSQLSEDTVFDGRDAFAEEAAGALEQAQSLYTRALEYEHKGESERALRCFKQISDYTTDYPGLQQDISRITQALELLGDWTGPSAEVRETVPAEEKAEAATEQKPGISQKPASFSPHEPPEKKKAPRSSASRTFFEEDEAPRKSRLVPITVVIILLLVGAAAGVNYYLNTGNYNKAAQYYADCKASLENNRFTDAEQQCESALGVVKQIFLFRTADRDLLAGKIERTLRSKPLREGLAGNLQLDGNYYPQQVVQNIQTFRKFKTDGDTYFANGKWQHAVSNYEQALKIAEEEESIDRQKAFLISENIKLAQFRITYESAVAYVARKKWVLATNDFNTALEQLKTLDVDEKASVIDDITDQLRAIAQSTEKEKGDTAFQDSRWYEAARHYRKALEIARQAPNADQDAIYELKQLVVKGDLYSIISTGKSAFRKAQWDMAIDSYDQAITLLEDNRELLKQANTDENRKKLTRILLQAAVIRDKQSAARHLKEHEYDEASAKLEAIIESITASEFAQEQVFVAALEEAKQSIEQAQKDRLLSDKISYLEDNFEALFTKHYSGAPPESLTERTVIFDKQMGDVLLFRLQCVEIGRGRPLQLVMKYAHDLETGSWSFYSDTE